MKRVVTLRNGRVAVLLSAPIIWLNQGWAYIGALVASGTGELVDRYSTSLWTVDGKYRADGTVHPFDVVSGLGRVEDVKDGGDSEDGKLKPILNR